MRVKKQVLLSNLLSSLDRNKKKHNINAYNIATVQFKYNINTLAQTRR